jgi:hypothetical protein
MLDPCKHFMPSVMFVSKAGANQSEAPFQTTGLTPQTLAWARKAYQGQTL